ncbi:Altered inheritance rate of mitochondria protein 29 [Hanseniaspora vineae]
MNVQDYDQDEPLTTSMKPLSMCTLTIRVIKSFPYRNVKPIVLTNYDITSKSAKNLYEEVMKHISSNGAFRPFRNVQYDHMKVYTHAHKSKTVNLVINFDHDDDSSWVLDITDDEKKLSHYDIANETEISLYKLEDYEKFKANPEEKW